MLNRNLNIIGATLTILALIAAIVVITDRYQRCMKEYVDHLREDLRDVVHVDTAGGDQAP